MRVRACVRLCVRVADSVCLCVRVCACAAAAGVLSPRAAFSRERKEVEISNRNHWTNSAANWIEIDENGFEGKQLF